MLESSGTNLWSLVRGLQIEPELLGFRVEGLGFCRAQGLQGLWFTGFAGFRLKGFYRA